MENIKKGKSILTERKALMKLKDKRQTIKVDLKRKLIYVYNYPNGSTQAVGNSTLGVIDYLIAQHEYSSTFLTNSKWDRELFKKIR